MPLPCVIRYHWVKKSLTKPGVCVYFFQRGQLWAGCTDSGHLFLWHTDHRCARPQRISLPGVSGVTCMIQVKNQVRTRKRRQGKFLFLTDDFSLTSAPPFSYGWAAMVSVMVRWEVWWWWWILRATLWQKSCRPTRTASRHFAQLRIATYWAAPHAMMARLPSGMLSEDLGMLARIKKKRNFMWKNLYKLKMNKVVKENIATAVIFNCCYSICR